MAGDNGRSVPASPPLPVMAIRQIRSTALMSGKAAGYQPYSAFDQPLWYGRLTVVVVLAPGRATASVHMTLLPAPCRRRARCAAGGDGESLPLPDPVQL